MMKHNEDTKEWYDKKRINQKSIFDHSENSIMIILLYTSRTYLSHLLKYIILDTFLEELRMIE